MKESKSEQIHVHVVNDPRIAPEVFHIDEQRFRSAFVRNPGLCKYIGLTIGLGDEGFSDALRTANVLVGGRYDYRKIVSGAPRLKWIHQTGAGIDQLLPLDWLPDNVILTNSSGVHIPKAGEFIACALLMLSHLVPTYVTNQREHRWVKTFGDCIEGKTLLVIGVGRVGGEAARRAKQLGLRVLGVRRSGNAHPHVDRMYRADQLREALPEADFVLISAPLTSETAKMIGPEELDLLKDTASVINMARGNLLDNTALAERLNEGRLRGGILDVFVSEPLPEDSLLWDCRNLIIIPHVAADAPNYLDRMFEIFTDNFQRFVNGEPLRNVVERAREY